MALKIKKIEYHKAKKLPSLPLPLKYHNLPTIKTQYNPNNNSVLNEVHLECKRAIADISQKLSDLRHSNDISFSNYEHSYTTRLPNSSNSHGRLCFRTNSSNNLIPFTHRNPIKNSYYLNSNRSFCQNSSTFTTESPFIGDSSFGFLTSDTVNSKSPDNFLYTKKATKHKKSKSYNLHSKSEYKRKKVTNITFDKLWYKSNGLTYYPIFKPFLKNPTYQHKTITDQITILYDDIHILKKNFFGDRRIKQIIKRLPFQNTLRLNILIEESVTLIYQTTKKMLTTYYDEIDFFINIYPPNISYLSKRIVKDEVKEFNFNVMLLNKASLFLKGCLLIFDFITHKNELYLLKPKDFINVKYFLDRARMNVTELFFAINNYYKNYIYDITLLEKYKEGMNAKCKFYISKFKNEDAVCGQFKMNLENMQKEMNSSIKKKYYTNIDDRVKRLDLLFFESDNFYLESSMKTKNDKKENEYKSDNITKIKKLNIRPGYSIVR